MVDPPDEEEEDQILPRPIKTVKFDDRLSLAANWDLSDPLCDAWYAYAPAASVEIYRGSGSKRRMSSSIRRFMEQEVRSRIVTGEAVAIGIRTRLGLSEGPMLVPASLFGLSSVKVDWDRGTVVGQGQRYESVRLCGAGAGDGHTRPIPLDKPGPAARAVGRPSLSPDIDRAINALYEEGVSVDGPPWGEPMRRVYAKGTDLGLADFLNGQGPSYETIRRRLVAHRTSKPAS